MKRKGPIQRACPIYFLRHFWFSTFKSGDFISAMETTRETHANILLYARHGFVSMVRAREHFMMEPCRHLMLIGVFSINGNMDVINDEIVTPSSENQKSNFYLDPSAN
jgi:hypothetical protein